jgi:hypothetical protein
VARIHLKTSVRRPPLPRLIKSTAVKTRSRRQFSPTIPAQREPAVALSMCERGASLLRPPPSLTKAGRYATCVRARRRPAIAAVQPTPTCSTRARRRPADRCFLSAPSEVRKSCPTAALEAACDTVFPATAYDAAASRYSTDLYHCL